MGFTFNKKLPIPKEIKAMYPLSPENAAKKAQRDKEIRDVITGADDRFLVIIGPCSADNEPAWCSSDAVLHTGQRTLPGCKS